MSWKPTTNKEHHLQSYLANSTGKLYLEIHVGRIKNI